MYPSGDAGLVVDEAVCALLCRVACAFCVVSCAFCVVYSRWCVHVVLQIHLIKVFESTPLHLRINCVCI